jgi:peptidoglycan hydrolase CwlO-like protein
MTNQSEATGRTPWDFATEFLRVLARIGPSAIVVAGFLVFGYFLYQEINKARVEADKQLQERDKQLQERLDTAQKHLVETYDKIAGMSDKLIENVNSLLTLSADIDKAVKKRRDELKKAEKGVEAARREAAEAKNQVEAERKWAEEVRLKKEETERQLQAQNQRLDDLRDEADALQKDRKRDEEASIYRAQD